MIKSFLNYQKQITIVYFEIINKIIKISIWNIITNITNWIKNINTIIK